MKILGIDTSTRFLCLGIYDGPKFYGYNLEVGTKLSLLLIPTIERVLEAAGLSLKDIDYFASGIGPGSFTGLRVGLAAIKGLSFALRKPVLAISTLDILARNICATDKYIIPLIDAKRNLIYTAFYKINGQTFQRVSAYMLFSEQEFLKKAKNNAVFLGDGLSLFQQGIILNKKAAQILDKDYWYPKPQHLMQAALEKIKHKDFVDSSALQALYLYPKECQIRAKD